MLVSCVFKGVRNYSHFFSEIEMYRIGYTCKYKHTDTSGVTNKAILELEKSFNTRTTTAKWCRDNPAACGERI